MLDAVWLLLAPPPPPNPPTPLELALDAELLAAAIALDEAASALLAVALLAASDVDGAVDAAVVSLVEAAVLAAVDVASPTHPPTALPPQPPTAPLPPVPAPARVPEPFDEKTSRRWPPLVAEPPAPLPDVVGADVAALAPIVDVSESQAAVAATM